MIDDTQLTGGDAFESAHELKPDERDILIGHGNEPSSAATTTEMTARMQAKLKREQNYDDQRSAAHQRQ